MLETIVCSAIHYNDGLKYEGQPKGITEGFVICGRRHGDCYKVIENLGLAMNEPWKAGNVSAHIKRENQGFITSSYRYVNRREAMEIAKDAFQLLNPALHEGNDNAELTSEDLFFDI